MLCNSTLPTPHPYSIWLRRGNLQGGQQLGKWRIRFTDHRSSSSELEYLLILALYIGNAQVLHSLSRKATHTFLKPHWAYDVVPRSNWLRTTSRLWRYRNHFLRTCTIHTSQTTSVTRIEAIFPSTFSLKYPKRQNPKPLSYSIMSNLELPVRTWLRQH